MFISNNINLPPGCLAFGNGVSESRIKTLIEKWILDKNLFTFLLVLGGSHTAEIEGISAAGATASSRRFTAVADAEFLLKGPSSERNCPLPPLKAGVSPAVISFAASSLIGIDPLILAVGLPTTPTFPHLRLESVSNGPANCLTTGRAMTYERVVNLWNKGFSIGKKLHQPILIAECVPGGTSTAQAVLSGFGISVADFVSGSGLAPPKDLKRNIVEKGLKAAELSENPLPQELIAAVGDPFQAVAAGILLGAREAGQSVILGGGSQMLAVLSLALSSLPLIKRKVFVDEVSIVTTSWLLEEGSTTKGMKSNLVLLMDTIGTHFKVNIWGLATGLRFSKSRFQALRDYEIGYVKEGVGAGALSFLAQLNSISLKELLKECELIMEKL